MQVYFEEGKFAADDGRFDAVGNRLHVLYKAFLQGTAMPGPGRKQAFGRRGERTEAVWRSREQARGPTVSPRKVCEGLSLSLPWPPLTTPHQPSGVSACGEHVSCRQMLLLTGYNSQISHYWDKTFETHSLQDERFIWFIVSSGFSPWCSGSNIERSWWKGMVQES